MSKYINLEKQLVRLYQLGLNDEEVIKQFLLTACTEDVQKVRHGHWTNLKISISGNSSAECSLCGAVVHNSFSNVINYCPNCGSRIDLGGDEDE